MAVALSRLFFLNSLAPTSRQWLWIGVKRDVRESMVCAGSSSVFLLYSYTQPQVSENSTPTFLSLLKNINYFFKKRNKLINEVVSYRS